MAVVEMPMAAPSAPAAFPGIEPLLAFAASIFRHPLVKVIAVILAAPVIWLAALGCVAVVMACELAPARRV